MTYRLPKSRKSNFATEPLVFHGLPPWSGRLTGRGSCEQLPALPHGRQVERVEEQDLAELPRIHLNDAARVEHGTDDPVGRLIAHRGNASTTDQRA